MPARKLTQLAVDRLAPSTKLTKDGTPTHENYFDQYLKGFCVRVAPTGRKSWITLCYPNGKQTWVTLGTTAQIPSIARARDLAREAQLQGKQGISPNEAKKAKAVEDKTKALAEKAQAAADSFTFAVMVDQYLRASKAEHRPRTHTENYRLLRRAATLIDPQRPARDILRAEWKSLRKPLPGQGAPLERANIIRAAKRAYEWAVEEDHLETNPIDFKQKGKARARSRVLSDDEIRTFWTACDSLAYPFGTLFKLLLTCGQRLNETAGMCRSELDLDAGLWTLPASRTKNAKEHTVPLPQSAIDILKRLPRYTTSDFVFTANGRQRPVSGFAFAKRQIVNAMGVADWGLHDLRRTVATGMQKLGVQLPVTEAVLNHISGSRSGIIGIYQRHDYAQEKAQALNLWSDYLNRLVEG